MRAWPPPDSAAPSPPLPPAPPPQVYDRRADRHEPAAADPGRATLYVCGITPYDATHIGHAATYVAFDLLVRAWRAAGSTVTYVQNVTDVDDPLLERAAQTGEDWRALAERETELFRADMTALGVVPPEHYVGAVEAIPLIVDLVERIGARGGSYDLDGDCYLRVQADSSFGAVSGLDRSAMLSLFAERGGDPDRPGKRDPLDSLLWQAERPGEPSWPTRLGVGRPGWHVECAAIARTHLGAAFDVQGGGSDLVFPHHEHSAASAQVAFPDEVYARRYVHAGMVGYDGHKMSKSRGNLVLVSTLRADGVDPRAIRLALLAQHYRSDWQWRPPLLEAAQRRLARWQDAVRRHAAPPAAPVVDAIHQALAADLDAPAALVAIDDWAAAALGADNSPEQDGGRTVAAAVEQSLGVPLT